MTTTTRTRTIRRATAPLLALVTMGALAPLPANAAKPITGPPAPLDDEFVIPAGTACDFDLIVAAKGKAGAILFEDGRAIFTAPGLKMAFSRAGSDVVFETNATGTFHDQPGEELPDGTFRFDTRARGHNVLFGPFDEPGGTTNGARLYVGNVSLTLTFDPATEIYTFSDVDASAARVVDICAQLS